MWMQWMHRSSIALASAALLVAACDDGDAGGNGTESGGASTGGRDESGSSTEAATSTTAVADSSGGSTQSDEGTESSGDGSSTGGAPVSCRAPSLDETFEIDPDGANGQIQPGVVYDAAADGVWVAYNAPAVGSSQFDVYVTRLDCGGGAQVEPTRVNATVGDNDIDPELARSGDDIVVVWSADNGNGGDSNLSIRMQSLDADGQPLLAEDAVLTTTTGRVPFMASAWMPRIAATEDGFAVIGTRAIESASAFQVFVQRLAGDTTSVGQTAAFDPIVGVANDTPHLAVEADGSIASAWVRTEDFELRQVETGRVVGESFESETPSLLIDADATGPALAVGADGTYLAVSESAGAGRRIRVQRLQSKALALAGEGGGFHHTPALVALPGGAALLWMHNLGGFSNELLLARLTDDGGTIEIGAPQTIPDAIAAPYATTMTAVTDDVVFIAWAQGDSPNFRVYGRFVSVAG